jgi:N utilization substance protein B
MSSRRKSREYAMQMLYQWELGGNTPEQVAGSFFRERRADSEVESFARQLFQETVKELEELDRLIREHAKNWRLERMAAVDRAILRVGVHELRHCPETPPAVVIDEALEIARRYSTVDSVEFVNGILDGILKKLPAREAKS